MEKTEHEHEYVAEKQHYQELANKYLGEVKDFPIITPIVDTKHLSPQCNHTVNEFCDHCITNGVKIESTPK